MLSHHRVICAIVENGFHSPGPEGRFNSFLELGSYPGNSVAQHIQYMSKVVAVDIRMNHKLPPNVNFYHGTTDSFFEQNNDKFDAIFIDADHSEAQVLIDFENSIKVLNPGGILFFHDTDPITERFTDPGLCNDSYRVMNKLNTDKYSFVNLPITSEGLCILQRKNESRVDRWLP